MLHPQSFAKYLRLTLAFIGNSALRESLLSVFQKFFASINKSFILLKDWVLGYHFMNFRHLPDIS